MFIGADRRKLLWKEGFLPTEGFIEEVHPLHVRALVIGGDDPVILVSIEMTSLPVDEVEQLKQIAAGAVDFEVDLDRIWIMTTHTFSAPHIMPDAALRTEEDRNKKQMLQDQLYQAVLGAVEKAALNMKNVPLVLHEGRSDIVKSRDIELPEGWWVGCQGQGKTDPTLTVVDAKEAVLVHLNLQSSVLDGTGARDGKCVSGDVAGVACSRLEAELGVPVLFLIGAAADQAPIEKAKGLVPDGQGGYMDIDLHEQGIELAEKLGGILADEVRACLAKPGTALQGAVEMHSASVLVPAKKMNRNLHELRPTHFCDWEPDGEDTQPISLLVLGNLALLGVRPELTYETDRDIKARSPFPYTRIVTLVNGGAKYMADRSAYEKYMYEAINSPFGEGAAERLANSAVTMLQAIRS